MRRLSLSILCLVALVAPTDAALAAPSDDEIARKARKALEAMDQLKQVRIEVRAGLVVIEGTTQSAAASERAEALVTKLEGVIGVENKLRRPQQVIERLTPALARLKELGLEALTWLPLLGVALAILLVFWLLARLVGRWNWLFERLARNRFARDLLRQFVRTAIFLGGLLLALEILDATALVGAVLGTAGIVGLAIGFAFRDLFENYLASILLSVRRPFGPGDHVRIGDDEGKVVLLTTRATILRTLDGNHLRILNADVYKARILNYSRNSLRRFDFAVGVGVDEDLTAARKLGAKTLSEMQGVIDTPAPQVLVEELGDSSVLLRHYGWVDQDHSDFSKVRGEAIRRVKLAFDDAGFDMPEPIQRVRLERWRPPTTHEDMAPPPASDEAPIDIAPDRHLDDAIAAERAAAGGEDLLDTEAESELEPTRELSTAGA